jgi:hypothetical protein
MALVAVQDDRQSKELHAAWRSRSARLRADKARQTCPESVENESKECRRSKLVTRFRRRERACGSPQPSAFVDQGYASCNRDSTSCKCVSSEMQVAYSPAKSIMRADPDYGTRNVVCQEEMVACCDGMEVHVNSGESRRTGKYLEVQDTASFPLVVNYGRCRESAHAFQAEDFQVTPTCTDQDLPRYSMKQVQFLLTEEQEQREERRGSWIGKNSSRPSPASSRAQDLPPPPPQPSFAALLVQSVLRRLPCISPAVALACD